ncbi:MAG: sialidase family protein [Mycobacteriales bacterium]
MNARALILSLLLAGAALAVPSLKAGPALAATAAGSTCPTAAALSFAEPTYVETHRAGGEPLVATLPSGRLLYSAHAGTTHFFAPEAPSPGTEAFAENYEGQTYIWTSDDNGKSWQFRPRLIAPNGAPASGFSDPEVAIDSAGTVYFSEINLANVAVSSSKDQGSSFNLENFFGAVLTDRQWMEADRPGELYFVANAFGGGTGAPPDPGTGAYISKSTDGGKTFTRNVPSTKGGGGLGDIRVDKRTGIVYQAHYAKGVLTVGALRNARSGDLASVDLGVVAEGVQMLAHWPAFDLDPAGNLYLTWDERGTGDRPAGVYFATSRDEARSWSAPVRVSTGDNTAIWPWLGVGDIGRVGIAWLEADRALPNHNAETAGTHGWRIRAAVSTNALGCSTSPTPSFSLATATPDPVHRGTICQGGTTCQAFAIDRRLGDYFSVDVDGTGHLYAGYSDTRVPGAVSLPGFVRQSGGPSLLVPKPAGSTPTSTTGQPAPAVEAAGEAIPVTGADGQLPLAAALLALGAALLVRTLRRQDRPASG